jgi:hypothetical protein
MNNNWEGCVTKELWHNSTHYLGISLKGPSRTMNNLNQDSRYADRYLNSVPPHTKKAC